MKCGPPWKRPLMILDKYGFEVEMGHKEVGGVKAKMGKHRPL